MTRVKQNKINTIWKFKVRGAMAFPVDMLRYDACWPADIDSGIDIVMDRKDVEYNDIRTAIMTSHQAPTQDRWRSFGWDIVDTKIVRLD